MPATHFTLTPAESKRLIARAIPHLETVKTALSNGIVIVSTGSTNTYILEALLGERVEPHRYLSGITLPTVDPPILPPDRRQDLVLVRGIADESLDRYSALEEMGPGDVVIKGANALNYREGVAGVCIGGHGGGGTIGAALGHVVGRRLHLVLPVGLEKCIAGDIYEIAARLNTPGTYEPDPPRMMPVRGHIFTEIEALRTLADVDDVHHMASGGIGGAEGAIRLLVEGSREAIEKAQGVIGEVQGEPPFLQGRGR